jgi:hypothetical protein
MKTTDEIIETTRERNKLAILETGKFLKGLRGARDFAATHELMMNFVDWLNEDGHFDEDDLLKLAAVSVQRKEKSKEEGLELFTKAWECVS